MRAYRRTDNLITTDGRSHRQYNYDIVIIAYKALIVLPLVAFFTPDNRGAVFHKKYEVP